MTDPTIDRLLGSLSGAVVPEPAVAERIRTRVAAELRDQSVTEPFAAPALELREATTSVALAEPHGPPDRPMSPRVMAAAAAVVLVAVIGAFVLSGSDEDSLRGVADDGTGQPVLPDPRGLPIPVTTPPDPRSSYVEGGSSVLDMSTTNPYWVAPGDGVVWVVSLNGLVSEVDPDTLDLGERFEISESSLVAAGHGSLWVADATTGQVLRYRWDGVGPTGAGTTPPSATIETGIRVDDRTFRDGRLGMLEGLRRQFARIGSITTGPGEVWVTDLEGRVLRIDPDTDEIVQRIAVDLEPHLVRSEGRYVAVADQDSEVAAVYDIVTGAEVFRQEEIGRLVGLELHRGAVFVHDGDAGTVTRYDLSTGVASATAALESIPEPLHVPLFPPSLRATDAGVVVPNLTEVVVLETDTLEVVRTLDIDGRAGDIAIGPDGAAWITQFYGRTLTRLETAQR